MNLMIWYFTISFWNPLFRPWVSYFCGKLQNSTLYYCPSNKENSMEITLAIFANQSRKLLGGLMYLVFDNKAAKTGGADPEEQQASKES